MNSEYKIGIDSDGELSVIRIADGKLMATVQGGEILPTAPTYHKFKDEFAGLLADHLVDDAPEAAATSEFPEPAQEMAGWKEVDGVDVPSSPPKDCDAHLGDLCPIFIAWMFVNKRQEADKRYAGRDVATYETLITAEQ